MTVYKTYDAIRQNYYVPNLNKKFNNYIKQYVACQTRNFKKGNPKKKKKLKSIKKRYPYHIAEIALDLSGPYPHFLRKQIHFFTDCYLLRLAFCVADNQLITQLIQFWMKYLLVKVVLYNL